MGCCAPGDDSIDHSAYSAIYTSEDKIGLSVGGAKDINNFRQCIEADVMPSNGSITYNGLLYEYYFDTSSKKSTNEMKENSENDIFYPTYCYAKTQKLNLNQQETTTTDTKQDEYEYYLSVGLNSNIKQNQFKRKHLNLVIALDTSGSMNTTFDTTKSIDENKISNMNEEELINWMDSLKIGDEIGCNDPDYKGDHWWLAKIIDIDNDKNEFKVHFQGFSEKYDRSIPKNYQYLMSADAVYTKLKSAKEAIISLCQHLTPNDRIGLIIFNKNAQILHDLEYIKDINLDALKSQLLPITAGSGTNFEDGYNKAISLYDKLQESAELDDEKKEEKRETEEEYENRIFFLTDAQINAGDTNSKNLLEMVDKYAKQNNHIYTTFIGIGLDFNSNIVEQLSNTRGCNYYCIKTIDEFNSTMNREEFEYMVTPLVFDICLTLICEGDSCIIETVYGVTDELKNNIKENGEIVRIHTLFPTKRSESKNETKGGIQLIKLKKNNVNENDVINCELEVTFEDRNGKLYINKQFITFDSNADNNINSNFYDNKGIRKAILLCKYTDLMIEWIENTNTSSVHDKISKLIIHKEYKDLMQAFLCHFQREMNELNDDTLQKEVDIMTKLINQSSNP